MTLYYIDITETYPDYYLRPADETCKRWTPVEISDEMYARYERVLKEYANMQNELRVLNGDPEV